MGIDHITLKHEKGKYLGLEERLFIKSLTEIGEILQLSKQRVAQIEKDIFKTLRNSEYATTLLDFVA